MIADMKNELRKNRDFFHNKQNKVMHDVYDCLIKKKESIDSETLLYFPEKFSFTSEEFHCLCESIFNYAKYKDHIFEYDDIAFPNSATTFTFKDMVLELFEMNGQGVHTQIKIIDGQSEFNYDDIKFVE